VRHPFSIAGPPSHLISILGLAPEDRTDRKKVNESAANTRPPALSGRTASSSGTGELRRRFRILGLEPIKTTMPGSDKSSYTDKQKREAEHIEEGYENRDVPERWPSGVPGRR
jgi:hypothetical protein